MGKIMRGDRCADCRNCRVWTNDHRKATCDASWRSPMKYKDGFHPDQPAPAACVGQAERRY